MPARPFPRWLALLLVAIAARALTFGNPILHVDEEFYFTVARAMTHGALPFVDVWDRKPIGLFLIYYPAALVGVQAGVWAYQMMALAAVVGTAALAMRLADRAGWQRGSLAAGIAYILWLNFADGQGGQAPVFYNLLMAGAAALMAPRAGEGRHASARWWRGFTAMLLVGLSLQIKYSVVFEGLFFGLWWMWREYRLGRSIPFTFLLAVPIALAALLPTAAAWGWFAAEGHQAAFVYANFTSILARKPDPWTEQVANLLILMALLSPLLAMAWVSRKQLANGSEPGVATFLRGWLVAAILGLLAFGSWFNHYSLPVMLPAATCAAGWFAGHRRGRQFGLAVLIVAFLVGQGMIFNLRRGRGTPAQMAAITDRVGTGAGCLYVYSGPSSLYSRTGRCALTRYIFPSHLGRTREEGAIGVEQRQEVLRILAARPEVIVLRGPYAGERADLRTLVEAVAHRDYRLAGQLPQGNSNIEIWKR